MRIDTVVVTGGSRGLGRGLVEAFLARGVNVAFCGRSRDSLEGAERALSQHRERLLGVVADMTRYEDAERVWAATEQRFGAVDVWINNAGTSNVQRPFAELTGQDISDVVSVNLAGTMNGAHVALRHMTLQRRGIVLNMEGFGSDGSTQPGMALYGATKRAIRYFTRSLIEETRGGPVKVCSLSPGMVVTDLLVDVYRRGDPTNWRRKRWLFKLIADPVEVVAPWLVQRILADPRHGQHIAWMTVTKAVLRVFSPRYLHRDPFAGRLPAG